MRVARNRDASRVAALGRHAVDMREVRRHVGLTRRSGGFGYLGWAGQGNLGDDAMYEAHQMALDPLAVVPLPVLRIERRLRMVSWLPGGIRAPAVLLGGGTLFGRTDWWRRVGAVRAVMPNALWMTLGVGVEDPDFSAKRVFTDRDAMRTWTAFAASWPLVGVRGPRSQEILDSYGLRSEVTGDPALLLAPLTEPATRVEDGLLGVSVAAPEAQWGATDQVEATVLAVLRPLRRLGWRFRFFVFSRWDRELTSRMCRSLGSSAELCHANSTRSLLSSLGACQVVLGERLHSVVLASAAGTPSVAIEYRPKIGDFMQSIGRAELAFRSDRLDPERLQDALVLLAANRESESTQIRSRVDELRGKLNEASVRARDLVESKQT